MNFKYISTLILFSFLSHLANGQTPFICDDKLYMAIVESNTDPSIFYEITIAENNNQTEVIFDPLGNTADHFINAFGYRRTDNLIYGIKSLTSQIYKVDATGLSYFVGNISGASPFNSYSSGDITTDGRFLILLAGATVDDKLVIVDLESPTFESTTIDLTLASNGAPSDIRCEDIAVDPTDNKIYGYNHFNDELIRIDMNTGIVEDNVFSGGFGHPGVMGALFFNSFGELFGYGRPQNSSFQNTLYSIDKITGSVTALEGGPVARGNDGCSCPYTININKEVFPTETLPCNEVEYTFTIANQTDIIQSGIIFTDILSPDMTITEIVENPFGGNIISGVGTSELIIEDMDLPIGKNQLVIKVEIGVFANGIIDNQASLTNLPAEFGGIRLSDNPNTLEPTDPTTLEVIPVVNSLNDVTETILNCNNEITALSPDPTADSYEWFDGSTDSIFETTTTGTYSVQVIKDCQYYTHNFVVGLSSIYLEPTNDLIIDEGDSITVSPSVSSVTPYILNWETLDGNNSECLDCPEFTVAPFLETQYQITAITDEGCIAIDTFSVFVNRPRGIYIPNAFSPNNDGFNDFFYVQSKNNLNVSLSIFDRWGTVIFEQNNCTTNNYSCGWDGRFLNKELNTGVYIYFAVVEFPDGSTLELKGDVTLAK